jgi:hypothetical protein
LYYNCFQVKAKRFNIFRWIIQQGLGNMKAQLNKIRLDNNFSPLAAILAERVIMHVQAGGFLGANAEHYAMGIESHGKIVQSGWQHNDNDIKQAWRIAQQFFPDLWEKSIDNFNKLTCE